VKVKLFLLMAVAVALFLFPLEGGSLRAQESTDVHGRVVNGTEGEEIPEDLSVLMLVTAANGRLAGTGQTAPDAQGRFVFEDVQIEEGSSYTFSVDNQGVFYGMSLGVAGLAEDLVVTVFETTRDASIIRVDQHVMVVVALFFFGGEIIHDFSFALLVGILVGTYSSIFIASAFLVYWDSRH